MTPDARCAARVELYRRDFATFAREQLKIKPSGTGAVIPLELNDGQLMMDRKVEHQLAMQGYVRLVLLKGRQLGGSTYWQARMFHRVTLFPNFNALLIACDPKSTGLIFEMSRTMFDEMEGWCKPMRRYNTKGELVFENPDDKMRAFNPGLRSRIEFQSASKELAGTGTTKQGLHLSEVAKFNADSVRLLKSSLMPAIHRVPGSFLVEESTAYVGGDHFREMIDQARSGKSDYVFVFVPWWLDRKNAVPLMPGEKIDLRSDEKSIYKLAKKGQPKIDVPPCDMTAEQFKWRRLRMVDIGDDLFEQEYPRDPESAWVNLDVNVFPRDVLRDMESDIREPLRMVNIIPGYPPRTVQKGGRTIKDEDYVAIWKEPIPGHMYDVGADVAAGVEDGDWSVAEIFDRETHEQVAEYHKHIDVIDYGTELYWLCRYYNVAQLAPEVNGPGYATLSQITKLAYPYVYRWRHRERDVPTLSTYAGWKTQQDSKQLIVSNMRHLVIHKNLTVRSRLLLDEMADFSRDGLYQYRANQGNDDAVMAAMIAIQIGLDESFGAPRSAPPEHVDAAPLSPAYRDDYDTARGDKRDPVADALMRELRGT